MHYAVLKIELFQRWGRQEDLEAAIPKGRYAVAEMREEHEEYAVRLNNFAIMLESQYERTGMMETSFGGFCFAGYLRTIEVGFQSSSILWPWPWSEICFADNRTYHSDLEGDDISLKNEEAFNAALLPQAKCQDSPTHNRLRLVD